MPTNTAVSFKESERDLRGMLASLTIGHAAIALYGLKSDLAPVSRTVEAVQHRLGDDNPQFCAMSLHG